MGGVISAMARKADHIPFKNSILTRLLQVVFLNQTILFICSFMVKHISRGILIDMFGHKKSNLTTDSTLILQPCLEGDGNKTLMFVNVSPNPESSAESLSSLRFAEQVNSCEVGVARRRV